MEMLNDSLDSDIYALMEDVFRGAQFARADDHYTLPKNAINLRNSACIDAFYATDVFWQHLRVVMHSFSLRQGTVAKKVACVGHCCDCD